MTARQRQQVPQICKFSSRSTSFCFCLKSAFVLILASSACHQVAASTKDAQVTGWTLGEDSWNYWWSYSGVSGPSYWGLLNLDWFICDKGRHQSPINIDTGALVYDAHLAPLRIADNNLLLSGILYNDGHAIVFNSSSALRRFTVNANGATALPSEDIRGQPTNNEGASAGGASGELNNSGESKNVSRRSIADGRGGEQKLESVAIEKRGQDGLYSIDVFANDDNDDDDSENDGLSLQLIGPETRPGIELLMRGTDLSGEKIHLAASGSSLTSGDRLVESAPVLVSGDASDQDVASGAKGDTVNQAIDGLAGAKEALADEADTDGAATSSASQSVLFTGAGLAYSYKFEALSLRFGQSHHQHPHGQHNRHSHQQTIRGSEHQINSRSFAGELQLMAYNWQLYKSYQEAATRPNGLLAIAILIDLLPERSADNGSGNGGAKHRTSVVAEALTKHKNNGSLNEQLEHLLDRVGSVAFRGQYQPIVGLNLTALLPDTDQFVTYEGSLTQPGCHETVTWLLLNRPLYIAKQSFDKLRSISADEQSGPSFSGTLLSGNVRPVQPINNRPIRTNIRPPTTSSREAGTTPNKPDAATCPRLWTRYEYIQAAS